MTASLSLENIDQPPAALRWWLKGLSPDHIAFHVLAATQVKDHENKRLAKQLEAWQYTKSVLMAVSSPCDWSDCEVTQCTPKRSVTKFDGVRWRALL